MKPLETLDQALIELDAQDAGRYVFASVDTVPPGLEPFAIIREAEGVTVVAKATDAYRYGLGDQPVFSRITAGATTSLTAVGLTATITQMIASRGIPCNVIAGYHHDHFFVPADRAAEVVGLLSSLSQQASGWLPDTP